jgi:hypothetical protein
MKMAGFAIGFLLGWLSSVPVFLYFQEPTAEEAGRTYMAYRACIERSSCQMTPQDWIDYYDLKWRLEEKEIE